MIKKSIYPKTERVKVDQSNVCEVTEKIDGSNLCIFKKNDILYIATRNNIINQDEQHNEKAKCVLYKGLAGWLEEHGEDLAKEIRNDSCICRRMVRYGAA